jgi:hypothetical protein
VDTAYSKFRREYINYLRATNHAFLDLLEGAPPHDAAAYPAYRNFQKKMFGYLCVVMKHLKVALALISFQPSFSGRVSPSLDAWRAFIDLFDQRGVGLHNNWLTYKLLDPQGEKNIWTPFFSV